MNRSIVVIAAALLVAGGPVLAAGDPAEEYERAMREAKARYDAALVKCDRLDGRQAEVCEERAESNYTREKAAAEARRDAAESGESASPRSTDADYERAKQQCESLAGSSKDYCLEQARTRHGR